jgi:maltooligosyltrehalose trehalohydrolase
VNEGEHAEMLDWYRQLIRLRRDSPSLIDGEPGHTSATFSELERWLSMERGEVTVSCNLGETEGLFPVPEGGRVVLGSRGIPPVLDGAIRLPPNTVVIISL